MSNGGRITFTCPKCGSALVPDGTTGYYKCSYCGHSVMFTDINQAVRSDARFDKRLAHNAWSKSLRASQERYRLKQENKFNRRELIKSIIHAEWFVIIAPFVTLILILFLVFMGISVFEGNDGTKEKIHDLKALESEIVALIEESKYDSALLKANQLRYDGNSEGDTYKLWEEKREEYIRIINEKKTAVELASPDTIFMPSDSNYFKGKNYEEMEALLKDLGFTNVSTKPSVYKPDLFHGANGVESLIVNGQTNFKQGEHFNKDVVIILYYYAP